MKVTETLSMTKRAKDGAFYGTRDGADYVITKEADEAVYKEYEALYNAVRQTPYNDRPSFIKGLIDRGAYPDIFGIRDAGKSSVPVTVKPIEMLTRAMKGLIDFFSEFGFTPSFRFTNTLALMACNNKEDAKTYVSNYFALMDSSYTKDVKQKIKSAEFSRILNDIISYGTPKNKINTRLKIYYGSAGTGKTTIGMEECANKCIICNSSMLPSDLLEDFGFNDGKAGFNPSVLWDCMEKGLPIMLDEINLLPFDSLRFLQGITDGKSEFTYKNRTVHIKEGFQIVGTMNLTLGGMTYGLPEPIVDRCCEIKEFILTPEQLAKSICGMNSENEGE